jgi:hypothetical protein
VSDSDTLPTFALLSLVSGLVCLGFLMFTVIIGPRLLAVDLAAIVGLLFLCPLLFARMEGRKKPEPPIEEGKSSPNT